MNPPCATCGKAVYPTEKTQAINQTYHKLCFKVPSRRPSTCIICSLIHPLIADIINVWGSVQNAE